MNSTQNIQVVVICPSEIILTGFSEILKNGIPAEIFLLRRCDELVDYQLLSGFVLILATAEEQEYSGLFIRKTLSLAQQLQFLTLNVGLEPVLSNQIINLLDAPSLICFKVNEVIQSFLSAQNIDADADLTRRELEVLQLITKGYSNKEIADHLFVSTHTVISHRKNISEKTGIKSASGLTMYAILKKIVDVNDIDTADLI